jgi:hypothetical protein
MRFLIDFQLVENERKMLLMFVVFFFFKKEKNNLVGLVSHARVVWLYVVGLMSGSIF